MHNGYILSRKKEEKKYRTLIKILELFNGGGKSMQKSIKKTLYVCVNILSVYAEKDLFSGGNEHSHKISLN